MGVELDEPLTSNSGIFGSRQYFDCPHGYGLMVSSTKVRKIRDVAFQDDRRRSERHTGMKSAKSFTDLSKLSKGSKYRISNGYRQLDHNGKSKSLLMQNHQLFDDPMMALNNIKRFQDYGVYGQPNLENHRSAQWRALWEEQYGLPLQQQPANTYPFIEGDLLRESFRRIVAPGGYNGYRGFPVENGLYRNSSMPQLYKSYSQPSSEHLFRTRSMPNQMHPQAQGRRVSSSSSYTSGLGSSDFTPTSQSGSAPFYYKYSQPLCPKCAACKVCAPMPISQLSGNTVPNFMPRTQPVYQTNVSDDSINLSDHSGSRANSLPTQRFSEKVERPERQVKFPAFSKPLCHLSPSEIVEYEKWKASYGKNVGRGMKKGLNKLHSAIQTF